VGGRRHASCPPDRVGSFDAHDRPPWPAWRLRRERHWVVGDPGRLGGSALRQERAAAPAARRFGMGPNAPGAHAPEAVRSPSSQKTNRVADSPIQYVSAEAAEWRDRRSVTPAVTPSRNSRVGSTRRRHRNGRGSARLVNGRSNMRTKFE
jgi:hypothetical protein